MRKTTKNYWDGVWGAQGGVPVFDPLSQALDREYDRSFDREVRSAMKIWGGQAETLIEAGCGGSQFLPYFAKQFGLRVAGIDYSETGCANVSQALADQGVDGTIHLGDMFSPPAAMGTFDVVVSIGLLEHFLDTAAAIRALSAMGRSGGMILSIIPNMTHLPGLLQKIMDRKVYDLHVPLDLETFRAAHVAAGLDVLDSHYWMTVNLNALNSRIDGRPYGRWLPYLRAGCSQAWWALEHALGLYFPNKVTSPYISCVARIP